MFLPWTKTFESDSVRAALSPTAKNDAASFTYVSNGRQACNVADMLLRRAHAPTFVDDDDDEDDADTTAAPADDDDDDDFVVNDGNDDAEDGDGDDDGTEDLAGKDDATGARMRGCNGITDLSA